jgi:hypothetical protein
MRNGFRVKSGGLAASPVNANALPGSERLVPNTTTPEKRDWATADPGEARAQAKQLTTTRRMTDETVRAMLIMM